MLNIKQQKHNRVTVYVENQTVQELVVSDILSEFPDAGANMRTLGSGKLAISIKNSGAGIDLVNSLIARANEYNQEAKRAQELDALIETGQRLRLV